jgi:hypothetical protein
MAEDAVSGEPFSGADQGEYPVYQGKYRELRANSADCPAGQSGKVFAIVRT